MKLTPFQYREHLYHIEMATCKSREEAPESVSGCTDHTQKQEISERSHSHLVLMRTISKNERLQTETSPRQEISERSHSRLVLMKTICTNECFQTETSPNLLQDHEKRNPLTTREILCDLQEDLRILLSSYINVLKKRLLSSLGVIKTPIPGRKATTTCHPPS
ncbi:uncharacterized protein LOC143786300 isoform X3 [Ranitomeya variabilis]|uniref:uncharacterized protein LOC143786300 isoform X3 n=1 Tax=Ranitomeya variabilis TaxID=490064 RepID=UPI004056AC6B